MWNKKWFCKVGLAILMSCSCSMLRNRANAFQIQRIHSISSQQSSRFSQIETCIEYSHQYSQYRVRQRQQRQSRIKLKMNLSSSSAQRSTNKYPPPYPVRVAVLGGGNFGLALSTVLGRRGIPVTLLVRSTEVAETINTNHTHPRYMSDITLPTAICATTDPQTALSDATYIIHAVPVQFTRQFLNSIKDYIPSNTPILSASKGIETSSLGFMADILKECLGTERGYAFLSGPSFAREICQGVATAVVIASEDMLLADDLADLMSSDNFMVFTSKDVMGVEVGGAVKNVIALAAGMCEGLGLGTNAMSGLVTRGCTEMRRLALTLGAKPSTIAGLSGKISLFISFCIVLSHALNLFIFQPLHFSFMQFI